MIRHIVLDVEGRAWVDRQTLAYLTKRSVQTIRAKCPIAGHHDGKALYDMDECEAILKAIPTRQRDQAA